MVVAGWVELTHGAGAGLWLMLVGLFISMSALAEVRRSILETALRGVRVAEVMSSPVITGADWLTVDRFLEEVVPKGHHSAIPLLGFDGRPSGIVDVRRFSALPLARRAEIRACDVAVPLARCVLASPEDGLVDVLDKGGVTAPLRILVLDAGQLVGIVTGHDISRIAQRRLPAPRATQIRPTV